MRGNDKFQVSQQRTACEPTPVSVATPAVDAPHAAAPAGEPVLVVGHQPTLGEVAAFLLSGEEAAWSIRKGAVWWFSNRTRLGQPGVLLKVAIGPDLV